MPTLNADQLTTLSTRLLEANGVAPHDAAVVAAELAGANLVGHDSHGVMRLVQYLQMMDEGYIKPDGRFEVVRDAPAFVIVDGNFHFGQVTAARALAIGLEKAKAAGTATVMMRNCNHVGRLGSYTDQAASAGFAAMMAVNAPGPGGVAPFGGIERKLGTNPISMAAPGAGGNIVLDMTTSATAEGKLRVAHQKGELVAEGMLIDGLGKASTNPGDYYNKPYGSILPLGGPLLGHKGYGLSVMIDVFCGMLSGSGVCRTDLPRGANGVWLYLLDIEHFVPRADYDCLVQTYTAYLKNTKRMEGIDEILLPGEIEVRRRQQREVEGVPIPDETWRQLCEAGSRLNVNLSDLC
jgi:hydroxycarboxylate dehydrogenase B